eukprot:Opistho-2@8941
MGALHLSKLGGPLTSSRALWPTNCWIQHGTPFLSSAVRLSVSEISRSWEEKNPFRKNRPADPIRNFCVLSVVLKREGVNPEKDGHLLVGCRLPLATLPLESELVHVIPAGVLSTVASASYALYVTASFPANIVQEEADPDADFLGDDLDLGSCDASTPRDVADWTCDGWLLRRSTRGKGVDSSKRDGASATARRVAKRQADLAEECRRHVDGKGEHVYRCRIALADVDADGDVAFRLSGLVECDVVPLNPDKLPGGLPGAVSLQMHVDWLWGGKRRRLDALSPQSVDDPRFPHLVCDDGRTMPPARQLSGATDSRVFFNFMYSANSLKRTEAQRDKRCPWCAMNCRDVYGLLRHLTLSHSRFIFDYTGADEKGCYIAVSVRGIGNLNDSERRWLATAASGAVQTQHQPIAAHSRGGVLGIIEMDDDAFEFLREDAMAGPDAALLNVSARDPEEFSSSNGTLPNKRRERRRVKGQQLQADVVVSVSTEELLRGRTFYSSRTFLPKRLGDLENDSDDEYDNAWLTVQSNKMMDEFTDVNEGEKEVMKMWNKHILDYGVIGDCQMPAVCDSFIERHGNELIARRLRNNFMLHIVNLAQYGLLKDDAVARIVLAFSKLASKCVASAD